MASTVPAKSQSLHNFSLSHLKWKSNHQRPRSSSSSASARLSSSGSPHRSPPFGRDSPPRRQSLPPRRSPLRRAADAVAAPSPSRLSPMRGGEDSAASPVLPGVSADESTSQPPPTNQSPVGGIGGGKSESCVKASKPLVEYRRQSRNSASCIMKNGVFMSTPDRDEKKLKGAEADNKESRSSKFLIKIRQKSSKVAEEIQVEAEGKIGDNEVQEEGKLWASFDDDEPLQKTWNFRPRKPIRQSLNLNGSGFKNHGSAVQPEKRAQSPQVNPNSRSDTQKKDKRKIAFTLTLSREEIEEDLFSLMGSKPSRRAKKRSKIVQKQIDHVFPGAWLESITADSYKVSEHPGKG